MKYIVIDPSGSFNEGKGHTGVAMLQDDKWEYIVGKSIAASDYTSRHEYWKGIIDCALGAVEDAENTVFIIESFVIRSNGFTVGKMPETIQFIGALVWELESRNLRYVLQTPSQAKARFKDELLPNYIPNLIRNSSGRYMLNGKIVNDHVRDALKHLLFYKRYKEK